jgi:hypothetical protein
MIKSTVIGLIIFGGILYFSQAWVANDENDCKRVCHSKNMEFKYTAPKVGSGGEFSRLNKSLKTGEKSKCLCVNNE